MRFTRLIAASLAAALVLVLLVLPAPPVLGGSGRYDADAEVFNLIVSLDWEASAPQIQEIEDRFTQASELLYDVTDGAMRFGKVTIFDEGVGREFADISINWGSGGAVGPPGPGVFGVSAQLFSTGEIYVDPKEQEDDTWQTIVHEFSHYAFGIKDEYKGPGPMPGTTVWSECSPPPSTSGCIMDNYKDPRWQMVSEFCWHDNHDPDGDSGQEFIWGQSCWDTIDDFYPTISAPGMGPDDPAPAGFVAPDFEFFDDPLVRVALVLDTSGSMNDPGGVSAGVSRLEDLQNFAAQFIDLMGLGDVELGIVRFASGAVEEQPATLLDNVGDVTAAKGNLPGGAGGMTSIGAGLALGRDLLTASAAPGPLVLILMTDGFHNHPPADPSLEPLAVLPSLIAEDIRIHTVGLGDSINADLLRQIAKDSGAIYWEANDSFQFEPVFASLAAVIQGGSLPTEGARQTLGSGFYHVTPDLVPALGGDPVLAAQLATAVNGASLEGGQKPQLGLEPVYVEDRNQEAAFNLGWAEEGVAMDLYLTTPSGKLVTPIGVSLGHFPNITLHEGPRYRSYRVEKAEVGYWGMAVAARANPTGITYAHQPTIRSLRVKGYADGELVEFGAAQHAIRVYFTARDGLGVTAIQVTARMTDPAGGQQNLTLYDDGDPNHGDAFAADGVYSAQMKNLSAGDGVYSFQVSTSVDPAVATVVPGEEPPPVVDNRTLYSVQRFDRSFPVAVTVELDNNPPREQDQDGDDHPDGTEGEEDLDCDGLPNYRDLDSDGDGIADTWDPEPYENGGCQTGGR